MSALATPCTSENAPVTKARSISRFCRLSSSCGDVLVVAVMTMAFTALPIIPAVRLTDMGLFDVTRFAFTTVEV
ncbi:adenine deaminase C-terminal domain-containing protein [Duodenibacillus massiliensis]|uniref:adenine deaminase C-terminal domain-containing protein n=1 Tax=Duodenibacillus massiliensis TaxID=1852381 RepID=UPI003C6CD651